MEEVSLPPVLNSLTIDHIKRTTQSLIDPKGCDFHPLFIPSISHSTVL